MNFQARCRFSILAVTLSLGFATDQVTAETVLTVERVAEGLDRPLDLTAPPNDRDRIFVVEQKGTIRIIKNGNLLGAPFLDLSDAVIDHFEGEIDQGLLGMTFHPDFENNGHFYVHYTRDPDGASVVSRFSISGTDPDLADPASENIVLGPLARPTPNHNGGAIQFGPDGYLYITMGDGGPPEDPNCHAQKGDNPFGKILRIDENGGIPPYNPFVGDSTFLDVIWSYGLRNPWKMSFDRLTGDLWIADVGQEFWEEVNFQPAGSLGGENYGWKVMEGNHCFDSSNCPQDTPPCGDPSFTDPIHEYVHPTGCSVTGGFVYRGCGIADLQGSYFFADYCTAEIFSFRYDGSQITDFRNRTDELTHPDYTISTITSFGEDADGELYFVDRGGEVFKIVAQDPPPAGQDLAGGLPGGSGVIPILDACGQLDSGSNADFRLRHANPSSLSILFVSLESLPAPFFGGEIVPFPPAALFFLQTDPEGRLEFTIPGGGGDFDLYSQYLIDDEGAVEGWAFSNALLLRFRP